MAKRESGGGSRSKPKGQEHAAAISQSRSGCPPGYVMRGGKCVNSTTGAVLMRGGEKPSKQRLKGVT